MRLSLLLALLVSFVCAEASAQLLGRRLQRQSQQVQQVQPSQPICVGPNCPMVVPPAVVPPIVVPPAQQQVKTDAEQIETVNSALATTPHVRCIFNGSCGSGTICGADQRGAYVVTNAHVVGTQIGRVATVDCVTSAGTRRVTGRIVMSGYSDRTMVDFAILFCEGLTCQRYMPMLKTEPEAAPYGTTGSPRCVWPQQTKPFNDPRNYGQGLITGTPNAIGGQSGSAIYNSRGQQIALLTWSIGGRCAGQKTSKLWQIATQRNVMLADPRPEGLVEVQEGPRPVTENGIFGSCDLLPDLKTVCPCGDDCKCGDNCQCLKIAELADDDSTTNRLAKVGRLENGIQNVVSHAMDQLPIWVEPNRPSPQPQPEQPSDPEQPCDPDCYKLTDKEWELIQFIRQQSEEMSAGRQTAIDWARLIPLIIEIVKIISQGLAK